MIVGEALNGYLEFLIFGSCSPIMKQNLENIGAKFETVWQKQLGALLCIRLHTYL
jgi:hypothetical protein